MDELPPLFGPGQRLGRYELLRRLAVGGMAEVYLAYAAGPGDFRKVVAIKRLLPQHALDPQLLRMFLDEARLMARLAHPNVPQVTDVDDGGTGEVPYFVMEYVHGTDLRGVLNAADGPLPIEHALAIAAGVAAGLHHAHEQRGHNGQPLEIVHRDVSPSNILISFDGGVKVTDFGVAKWSEQKSFTHQGQLKGKFAHMSPEQCRGEPLDRRSDVFALGTLLFEMTTGRPPFVAESEYELLTQIVSRDAPAPDLPGGGYPADLAAIVARSLGRAREDRYPSAQHLQLELEAFARKHRLMVSPVGLTAYIESLFGARVTEWREALASGKTLADHLARANAPAPQAGGNGAPTTVVDRTATDVYAPAPGQNSGDDAGPRPALTSTGTRWPAAARPSVKRVLAVGAAAGLAVTALWLATELTSRWQNVAPAPLPPVRAVESVKTPPTTGPATTGTDVLANRPTPGAEPPPDRPTFPVPAVSRIAGTSQPAGTVGRRAHDATGSSRAARRGRVTSSAAAGTADDQTAPVDNALPPSPPATAPEPGSPLPPAPSAARPVNPPAPSVKVWDPDSPVPP